MAVRRGTFDDAFAGKTLSTDDYSRGGQFDGDITPAPQTQAVVGVGGVVVTGVAVKAPHVHRAVVATSGVRVTGTAVTAPHVHRAVVAEAGLVVTGAASTAVRRHRAVLGTSGVVVTGAAAGGRHAGRVAVAGVAVGGAATVARYQPLDAPFWFVNAELLIGLTWMVLTSRTGDAYVWSDRDLPDPSTYYLGWKEPRAIAWGKISRALSDVLTGQYENAIFTVDLDDSDRLLRQLDEDEELIGATIVVYMITDAGRRALETPRTVFRGVITEANPSPTLKYSLTVKDPYAEHIVQTGEVMRRVFNQLDHPNCAMDKVPCSAEHYLVDGAITINSATSYAKDGAAAIGATTTAIGNGKGIFAAGQKFAFEHHDKVYTVTSSSGVDPETSITFTPALVADVVDNEALLSGDTFAAIDTGGGILVDGAFFSFAGHTTKYAVSSSRLRDPATYILFSPRLTANVANNEAVTMKATFEVPMAIGQRVPVAYGAITDRNLSGSIDQGDGQGPCVYVGDRVLSDGRTWAEFIWSGAACAPTPESPAGSPFQMLYFWNESLDTPSTFYYTAQGTGVEIGTLDQEADVDGRIALPGYGNWAALGYTTSYADLNGRRYTRLFLRGIFRDWALGILGPPDNLGGVPFSVNAYGCDSIGNGTGSLIHRGLPQYLHVLQNWLPPKGDCYQSGAWLSSPLYPDGTSMIDEASFATADAQSGVYVVGGFQGDFLLFANNEDVAARDVVARLNLSFAVQSGFNNAIQFSVHLINTDLGSTTLSEPLGYERDIFAGSFKIDGTARNLFTAIEYQHTQDYLERVTGGWRSTTSGETETENTDATTDYGGKTTYQTLTLYMLRGKNRSTDADDYLNGSLTIDAVLALTLARVSAMQHLPVLGTGPAGMNYELGDIVPITHYEGLSTDGYVSRPVRIERVEIEPSQFISGLEGYDIDPMVE